MGFQNFVFKMQLYSSYIGPKLERWIQNFSKVGTNLKKWVQNLKKGVQNLNKTQSLKKWVHNCNFSGKGRLSVFESTPFG